MKAKLIFVLFAVVCLTFVVGIGDVVAQNSYPVVLNLDWGQENGWDVEATAELCDENGDPFPEAIGILLTPNSTWTVWTGTIISDAEEAATIFFEWDDIDGWEPPSGILEDIIPITVAESNLEAE